jgi:hypothetical protein
LPSNSSLPKYSQAMAHHFSTISSSPVKTKHVRYSSFVLRYLEDEEAK